MSEDGARGEREGERVGGVRGRVGGRDADSVGLEQSVAAMAGERRARTLVRARARNHGGDGVRVFSGRHGSRSARRCGETKATMTKDAFGSRMKMSSSSSSQR